MLIQSQQPETAQFLIKIEGPFSKIPAERFDVSSLLLLLYCLDRQRCMSAARQFLFSLELWLLATSLLKKTNIRELIFLYILDLLLKIDSI